MWSMGLGSQPFWQLTGCVCNNTNTISVKCNIKFVKTFMDITIQLDTKQAGRHWYDTLFHTLADLGFQKTHTDLGVFYTRSGDNILILAIHVDDCIITGNSPAAISTFKWEIHACYAITDIRLIYWLLGIRVTCDCDAQTISLTEFLCKYCSGMVQHGKCKFSQMPNGTRSYL